MSEYERLFDGDSDPVFDGIERVLLTVAGVAISILIVVQAARWLKLI